MATGGFFDLTVTGQKDIVRNIERTAKALEDAAAGAIVTATEPTLRLMRRVVPKKTGKLAGTIRLEMGRNGAAKTSIRKNGSMGKTRIVGYLIAGDETTLVGGVRTGSKRGHGKGKRWQLARLVEFGTTAMPARPFFYPSWRLTKTRVKRDISKELRKAFAANPLPSSSSSEAA
jgi:HK97 gp10 family phage protein